MRILALLLAATIWFALSLLVQATVDFRYRRQEEHDHLDIQIRALQGLYKFKFEIPAIQLEWEKGPQLAIKHEAIIPSGKTRKSQSKLRFRYFWRGFFYRLWPRLPWLLLNLQRIKNRFYRGIRCTAIDWQVGIGYKDAASTGIAAGSLWALLGYSLARLYRQIRVEVAQPKLLVIPQFQKEGFFCNIHCIFHLRIGHIIFVGMDLIRTFMRGQRGKTHGESPD